MSNNKVAEKKVDNKVEDAVIEPTSEEKAVEAIQILKTQLLEHQRQAEHHQTMAVKAQGALEVLLQLHPQEQEENK